MPCVMHPLSGLLKAFLTLLHLVLANSPALRPFQPLTIQASSSSKFPTVVSNSKKTVRVYVGHSTTTKQAKRPSRSFTFVLYRKNGTLPQPCHQVLWTGTTFTNATNCIPNTATSTNTMANCTLPNLQSKQVCSFTTIRMPAEKPSGLTTTFACTGSTSTWTNTPKNWSA